MAKRNETAPIHLDERATEDYWRKRKIDWEQAYFTPDHPHRIQLSNILKELKFDSVLEVGCGAGANLCRIATEHPGVMCGGIDINEDAVKETLKHFVATVGEVENIEREDKSIDMILTDACLIYVPPGKIETAVNEMLRVARKYIVMVEWHNNEDIFDGHWVYNYKELFKNYDTKLYKITDWPGSWEKYGTIVIVEIKD